MSSAATTATTNSGDASDQFGRFSARVDQARDLPASTFRKRLLVLAGPFLVGVLGNSAISASSLSRTARAIASAPFSIVATVFGVAGAILLLGRYVRVSPRTFRVVAAISTFLLAFIIVTGSAVRLTGSGLGCPDWPTCKGGDVVPRTGTHAQIEFGNRIVTGLCVLAAAIGVLLALVRRPYRRDLVQHGLIVSFIIFSNAILGGLLVLTGLQSKVLSGHFFVAIASLTVGALIFHRARETGGSSSLLGRDRLTTTDARMVLLSRIMTGLILVGIAVGAVATGSGPHSGDPAKTERYPFDLELVAMVHSGVMWLALASVVAIAVYSARTSGGAEVRRRVTWLMAALVAQGGIGYLQWIRHLPAGLVQVHIVGAIVVWLAVLWVRAAVTKPAHQTGAASAMTSSQEGTRRAPRQSLQTGGPAS